MSSIMKIHDFTNPSFFGDIPTIAFDVDQTLVKWDDDARAPGPGKIRFIVPGNGESVYLTPHKYHLFLLKTYKHRGFKVIVWSAAGGSWASEVVKVLGIESNVDLIMNKLTAFYDDLPADKVLGQHLYFHDTLSGEDWKYVVGYEGEYEVSSYGRVRRICNDGSYQIKDQDLQTGYPMVQLKSKNRKGQKKQVHRLVAEAFIPNPENKPMVNHIDGKRNNNNLSNLEWCTAKENSNRKVRKARKSTQINLANGMAKLNKTQVVEIYKDKTASMSELSTKYGVSKTQIRYVKTKKSWKAITDQVDLGHL